MSALGDRRVPAHLRDDLPAEDDRWLNAVQGIAVAAGLGLLCWLLLAQLAKAVLRLLL